MSPYAVSKLAGEGYCRSFTQVYGLETVALRYFNVYGPRQDPRSAYAAVIPRFIDAFLDGRQPVIYGDGEQSRDFTYVGNVVDATIKAGDAPDASGRSFNIGSAAPASVNRIADLIGEILGKAVEKRHLPPRAGDIRDSFADISAAREVLTWEPQVDLETGLRLTVDALG